ncbi:MAG: ABC transporter substrate-binding protein [Thermodesulfobacteriota bacterium]
MIRWIHIAVALLLLVLPSACSEEKVAPPTREPLRVGWFLWTGWYPMAIAQERGLFAKHGARIEPVLYETYTNIFSDFAAGKLQGAFGGLYEMLKANPPGLRVVLVTDTSEGAEGLVVTPDIKTPRDLAGKRIGIQGAMSGSEFIITTLLRRNGLSRADLALVDVDPEIVLGQMPVNIQGGYTWEPFLSKALERGYRLLFTTADLPGMIPDVVAFHESALRERRDDVQGFVNAWFEAVEWWVANPEEGGRIIARATGLKPEEITLAGCRLYDRAANRLAFTPGRDTSSLYFTGRKQIEFFTSMGDVSAAPDLDQTLYGGFVQ